MYVQRKRIQGRRRAISAPEDAELRQHYDDLVCVACGYEGDGQPVLLGHEPEMRQARWDYGMFPQTHVITIYRCRSYFTSKPEFEPLDIHVTVEPTGQRMQNKGRKWKLLGLYGGEGAYWPDDLSPQTRAKGGISKMQGNIRQELRQAILEAICIRLGALESEIVGLPKVIRADTMRVNPDYDKGQRRGPHRQPWESNGSPS